jgi:hypothetical protein
MVAVPPKVALKGIDGAVQAGQRHQQGLGQRLRVELRQALMQLGDQP